MTSPAAKIPYAVSYANGVFTVTQPGKPAQVADAVVCQILGKVPYSLTPNQVKNPMVITGESLLAVTDALNKTTAVITMARFAPMAKPKPKPAVANDPRPA